MRNLYLKIPELHETTPLLVLATVTGNTGSTPQKPGSSALFSGNNLLSGTVGGGVVEGRICEIAGISSQTKNSELLHFSLDRDITFRDEAICGGEISILVDADPSIHLPVFNELKQSVAEKKPGVLITIVEERDSHAIHIERYWMTTSGKPGLPDKFKDRIESEVKDILSSADPYDFRQIHISESGDARSTLILLDPVFLQPKLIIAGAGHIGRALSHIGRLLDFEVTVIDDRLEHANAENLPDADHIIVGDIGEAMRNIEKGTGTYIVIVTRGHKDDANALKPCLGSDAEYIGMIGSRIKVAKMREEFIERGWAVKDQWDRIHSPVGLDIKSKTVEEIAVSIAAELIMVKNQKK